MNPVHIDDFYYISAEILSELYDAFPVRHLLLVEDLNGPIKWDITGVPDRKSQACFETMTWLSDHGLFSFRSLEPRGTGVEGAVLTQHGFVLLTGPLSWEDGDAHSRIEALRAARDRRAYGDLGTIIRDVLRANCHWQSPFQRAALPKATAEMLVDEES